MTKSAEILALEAYALANYEQGGDNVYETYDTADYQEVLDNCGGDLEQAKKDLRWAWKLIKEYGDDIRSSAF